MMGKIFSHVARSEVAPVGKSTREQGENSEFADTDRMGRGRDSTDHERHGECLGKKFTGIDTTGLASVTDRTRIHRKLMPRTHLGLIKHSSNYTILENGSMI